MDSKIFYNYIKNISFLICVVLIFIELIYLSKFVYNYHYYYNFGNTMNNINGNDHIEYETARFQVSKNTYNMKIDNDIYNSYNIKIIYYLTVFYVLLIVFLFALLFYNTFIKDVKCKTLLEKHKENVANKKTNEDSILFILLNCMCGSPCTDNVNECFFAYLVLLFIGIFVPLYIILKVFFYIDISYYERYYYLYWIIFFMIVIIRIDDSSLDFLRGINPYYKKSERFTIYLVYFICLIVALYLFFSVSEIYKSMNEINDTKSDITEEDKFYNSYSSEMPVKPDKPHKSEIIDNFKYYSSKQIEISKEIEKKAVDARTPSETIELANYNKYKEDLKEVEKYDNEVEKYSINMTDYNYKLNLYKLNIENPPVLSIFDDIIKNMFGVKNYDFAGINISKYILILFVICIILYGIYYYYKTMEDYEEDARLLYDNLFIPLFSLFLIILLINSINVLNTYINRYMIFNPLSAYKNDMTNINYYLSKLYNKTNSSVPSEIGNPIIYNIFSGCFSINFMDCKSDNQITISTVRNMYYNTTANNYTKPAIELIGATGYIKNNVDLIKFIKNIYYINDDNNIIIKNLRNNIINNINKYNTSGGNDYITSNALLLSVKCYKNITDEQITQSLSKYTNTVKNIVDIYKIHMESIKKNFVDALLKAGANCDKTNNINEFVGNINLYQKLINPVTADYYFTNKEIATKINAEFDALIGNIFNIINNDESLQINDPRFDIIKSNYNDYNQDLYTLESFQEKFLKNHNSDNEYLKTENNNKDNITSVQISSFVLFAIIILILLEPLYIEY